MNAGQPRHCSICQKQTLLAASLCWVRAQTCLSLLLSTFSRNYESRLHLASAPRVNYLIGPISYRCRLKANISSILASNIESFSSKGTPVCIPAKQTLFTASQCRNCIVPVSLTNAKDMICPRFGLSKHL